MDKNKMIGSRIQQSREAKGYTLQHVADEIGLSKSTILRYEQGYIEKLKIPVILALASVLDVSPSWLLLKSENKNEKPALNESELSATDRELISLLRQLTPEQSVRVMDFVQGILSAR